MVAKLTDRANVQALVDPPEAELSPSSPAFRGVQEATTTLLEAPVPGQEHQEPGVPDHVLPGPEGEVSLRC